MKLGHSPKVTQVAEECRASDKSTSLSRRYSRLFGARRIKIWKKIHCDVWGDVFDKAKGYSWLWVTRLHNISGKGQNDMQTEKIFNVEKYKKMLEAQRQSSVCGDKTIKGKLFPDIWTP